MSAEGGGGGGGGAMGGGWTNMNENLMALLEAVLSLAASDVSTTAPGRATQARNTIKAGGYNEEMFLNLSEHENDQFTCNICYQVLKETMQCLNHHKFCHSCLYVWSTTGQYANRVRCPVCRCQGLYFRDDEVDECIQNKRVKCTMAGCKWTGLLKRLPVHRHTNYGSGAQPTMQREEEEEDEESEEEGGGEGLLQLPYLGRAPPQLPHHSQSRFNGTGLQARRLYMDTGVADPPYRETIRQADTVTRHSTVSLVDEADTPPTGRDVGGGGGVLLRARRANTNHTNAATNNTTTTTGTSTGRASGSEVPLSPAPERRLSVRQRVHPIRRNPRSRITVRHTTTDTNNNVAATAAAVATAAAATAAATPGGLSTPDPAPRTPILSPEHTLSTPRQPRPPSGPRPAHATVRRRNLPGLSTATTSQSQSRIPSTSSSNSVSQAAGSSSPTLSAPRAPPTFNAVSASRQAGGADALNNFNNRLQESRDRLEGLMANFSGELERSRQEMADIQVERERQRREQLAEVRELGRRLGQVASELRHLLGNRRLRPNDADD